MTEGLARTDGQQAAWENQCLRCADVTPLDDVVTGCPRCAAAGFHVPIVPARVGGPAPLWPAAPMLDEAPRVAVIGVGSVGSMAVAAWRACVRAVSPLQPVPSTAIST